MQVARENTYSGLPVEMVAERVLRYLIAVSIACWQLELEQLVAGLVAETTADLEAVAFGRVVVDHRRRLAVAGTRLFEERSAPVDKHCSVSVAGISGQKQSDTCSVAGAAAAVTYGAFETTESAPKA